VVIMAPTRELAHQIYNECNKLATGRKWRIMQFSKATASLLADKQVRDKVGMSFKTKVGELLIGHRCDCHHTLAAGRCSPKRYYSA
jgi:superfamily II DNA/RNA helicase